MYAIRSYYARRPEGLKFAEIRDFDFFTVFHRRLMRAESGRSNIRGLYCINRGIPAFKYGFNEFIRKMRMRTAVT